MNFKEKFFLHKELSKLLKLVDTYKSDKNIEIYLVGGFVRDLIINRTSKDIDFLTIGKPYDLVSFLSKKIKNSSYSIYKNFGTASLKFKDYIFEFVGSRKESYSIDSRNPNIKMGSFKDDIKRRDFTINSLSISLNKNDFGLVIDLFDGKKDLKNKIIKTCLEPETTFKDDPLRMLRAVRFATQLSFDIENITFQGIINNKERIKILSYNRISDELNKIIMTDKPSYGFKLLLASGLLKLIFPEMDNLKGKEKINNHTHKDNFYHTLEVLDNVSKVSDSLWLRWAAILHDIAKPLTKRYNEKVGWTFHGHEDLGSKMVPKIFKRLNLPTNHHMKFVKKLVRLHLRPIALVKDNITDSAIRRLLYEAGNDIEMLMILCKADITSKNDEKVKKYLNNFAKVEKKMEIVEKNDKIKNFQPPIRGDEIINTFAINPSKIVGEIKDEIKERILEGKIKNNRKEAYNLMLKLGKQKGLNTK
ncbi:MAG: tRNA nucleotidyltransferase [Flammeovirgaceae bacterium]|mgnify:FL=1|nr:tRNA nucleotidyltransferase [Flammeovirgaceae bacterium]|tara:strand:- start:1780 stop:3204 length:1425 start_codon:yes stop_codon:yes gene_type:complete